jgi:IS5 family transposase
LASCHSRKSIKKIHADKGYCGDLNRSFLHLNDKEDGLRFVWGAYASERIMRKDTRNAKLTEIEIKRNKLISKKRNIVKQYFSLNHLHTGVQRVKFTTILKNTWDVRCRQMVFNMFRSRKLLAAV